MTEADWLVCEDAREMLTCLLNEHGANRRPRLRRKLRLFGCASSRLFCDATTDARILAAIGYMERFADGAADAAGMAGAQDAAHRALRDADSRPAPEGVKRTEVPGLLAAQAAFFLLNKRADWCAHAAFKTSAGLSDTLRPHLGTAPDPGWTDQLRLMSRVLRDIVGNPFRPLTFSRKWRTDTALALAGQMYDSRDFSAMPILADALQDAGCDSDDVLTHCRGPGPHVRGCWVVDSLLSKA